MFACLRSCRLFASLAVISALLMTVRWTGIPAPELAENRTLATWPESVRFVSDFADWRNSVDAWVTDNFPARRHLIGALNYMRWRLGYSGTARVVVGSDGWLFYDDTSHLAQVRPSTLAKIDLDAWARELQARTEFLSARGTPYVVLAAPVKESLFRERVPRFLLKEGATDSQDIAANVHLAGLSNYLDVHPALAAAKQDKVPIYSPYDTHWTGEGAYVAYSEIVKAFKQRGLSIEEKMRNSFRLLRPDEATIPQDLAYMLGIASFVKQEDPQLVSIDSAKPKITWLGTGRDWTADRVIDTGVSGPVLLMTGDSFSTACLPLLERSFSRIIFSHHQNGFFRRDLIDRYKPNAVLLEVIESGIRHAMPSATQITSAAPRS